MEAEQHIQILMDGKNKSQIIILNHHMRGYLIIHMYVLHMDVTRVTQVLMDTGQVYLFLTFQMVLGAWNTKANWTTAM